MKTKTLAPQPAGAAHENQPAHAPRYQIYRQGKAGNFMAELKTDSPTEAVEMFAIMSPAFDGGEIRIWDHHEQRICASVEWRPENTPFGFAVRTRRNIFQNPMLAVLARQIGERETMRESILAGVRLSA